MHNVVTLVGNVSRTPELRHTTSGAAVASFGLAVDRAWQKDGGWREQTSFFEVTCWAQIAENVCESIDKGARVMVIGRLDQQSWENDNGEKRSKATVVADDVGPSLRWATCQVQRIERENAEHHRVRTASNTDQPNVVSVINGEEPF